MPEQMTRKIITKRKVRRPLTRAQIKKAYDAGKVTLTPALVSLVFDHGMTEGDALRYLGL